MDKRGRAIIETLFEYFLNNPEHLEKSTREKFEKKEGKDQVIVISDFISGMTDRFAIQSYNEIINIDPKKSH